MVTFANLGSVRLPSLKFVGLRVRKIQRIYCVSCLSTTVSQLFEPQLQKNRQFYVPRPLFFLCPGTPLRQSRKTLHEWKDTSVLVKRLYTACTHLSSTVSQLFELQVQKNAVFTYQPTFLFPLETPLRLSRNMLHGWKDNSMLAKPLAAYRPAYLSSIVSELYDA